MNTADYRRAKEELREFRVWMLVCGLVSDWVRIRTHRGWPMCSHAQARREAEEMIETWTSDLKEYLQR